MIIGEWKLPSKLQAQCFPQSTRRAPAAVANTVHKQPCPDPALLVARHPGTEGGQLVPGHSSDLDDVGQAWVDHEFHRMKNGHRGQLCDCW